MLQQASPGALEKNCILCDFTDKKLDLWVLVFNFIRMRFAVDEFQRTSELFTKVIP